MKKKLPYILPIFRSMLFILGGLLFSTLNKQSLIESSMWWSVVCSFYNVITIFVLILICKIEGIKYTDLIKYKKGQINFKETLLVILLMLSIGVGGMYVFGLLIYGHIPTILIQPIPVWIAAINMIILPGTIIFAELPLYYGYSFNKIRETTNSETKAMIYVIFFYALQHSFIPLLFDWKYIVFRFMSFLPLMFILGILYNRKRNLVPLMIGHGFLDLATGIQILIMSIFPSIFEIIQNSVRP